MGEGGALCVLILFQTAGIFIIIYFLKQKRKKSCPDCRVKVVHFGPTLEGQGQGQGAG